jgi:hypothetical protein
MSSDNYQFAKASELQGVDKYSPYEEKQYQYIPDINSGVYANNSGLTNVQFDLASIYNSSKMTDTSDLFLTIPLVMCAEFRTAAGAAQVAPSVSSWALCSLKNGFHHLVHQIELKANGKTIQDSQGFTNIAKNFRLLSSMTESDLKNMACSLGMSDCLDSADSVEWRAKASINSSGVAVGGTAHSQGGVGLLNNKIFITNETSVGHDARVGAKGSSVVNDALAKRASRLVSLGDGVGGTNSSSSGIYDGGRAGASAPSIMNGNNLNEEFKCYYAVENGQMVWRDIAVLPVKHLVDAMDKFGLVRKLDAQLRLYLNTGSGSVAVANGATGQTPQYSSFSSSTFANTCPMTVNYVAGAAASPTSIVPETTASISYGLFVAKTPTTSINGTNFAGKSSPMPSCRAYYSSIELEPSKALQYISENRAKEVVYENFISNEYNDISSNGTFSQLVQSGIKNPLGCLIIPLIAQTQTDQVDGGGSALGFSQYASPFDTSPATASPISLSNLQVSVGGKNVLSASLYYTFENFLEQVALADTTISELNLQAGVFNQKWWELNRMYYCDLSRSSEADKATPRNLSVSFKNNSQVKMDCLIFTFYCNTAVLDVETGAVSVMA